LGAKEVYELDWWQKVEINGLEITFLPAQHWSRRLWYDRNITLWGSYLISGSKNIYFSGDTGYFVGFKEFGRLYDIDYALLGAGAYIPRWFMHSSHQNVNEFFKAADDLNAKMSIPMHFGIIRLGREPVNYPIYEVEEYIKENPEYKDRVRPMRANEYLSIIYDE
jgi:L-ascorbate metabolism protein UlaG (beta-lactamase superfamily)